MGMLGVHSRRVRRVLAAVGIGAVALIMPARSVSALEADPFEFRGGPDAVVEYEHTRPMAAPAADVSLIEPTVCAAAAWCTVVPFDVAAPAALGEGHDWLLNIELHWAAGQIDTDLAGSVDGNDLDLYVFRQVNGSYVEVGRSVSALPGAGETPEVVKLFNPEAERYWLIAANVTGVNFGFTFRVNGVDVPPGDFFGVLPGPATAAPPAAVGGGANPTSAPAVPRVVTPSAPAGVAPPTGAVDDFGFDFGARVDFEDELAGPVRGSLFEREELGPPGPVSSATVALWLGVVPLVLLAAGVAAFLKLRPEALTIRGWDRS